MVQLNSCFTYSVLRLSQCDRALCWCDVTVVWCGGGVVVSLTPPVDTEDGWEGSSWSLHLAPPQPDSRDQEQGHLVSADTSQAKVGILGLN